MRQANEMNDVSKAPEIDHESIAKHRLARVQTEIQMRDMDGVVLYDPINVRYATSSRNMLVWCLHNPVRYALIPAQGRPTIFEFRHCEHLSSELMTEVDIRPAIGWSFFVAGRNVAVRARAWAADVAAVLWRDMGKGARRIALDRIDPPGLDALRGMGIQVGDAQEIMEMARSIKCADEIRAMRWAVAVCELGMQRVMDSLVPGITENELWATFHWNNIAHGGEYIETRLLNAGRRTAPWFQECSDYAIQDGDVVCHDADMIGPYGFCVDMSRTHYCGEKPPPGAVRSAYAAAVEQVEFNTGLLKPGMSFREYADKAWPVPLLYQSNHYATTVHGVGLGHEWPRVVYPEDWVDGGCEGHFQPGMTLCVESYISGTGLDFGIKYTDQVLVTENGVDVLSRFPKNRMLSG